MENQAFDLDAFIAGVNQDKTQQKNPKDRLNRVLMNTRDNQGTVTIIPIRSKGAENFYLKIPRVYEFYGDTSLLQSGEAWYRILPRDMYPDLTTEQAELYNEVKGYLDTLNDNEEVSYDEFRVRNYALFFGICDSLKNTEGKKNDKLPGCPCIFVYPSNSVIDAFGTAINNKIEAMKGRKEWIPMVLSPNNTGRKGVMMISFVKSASPGYDSTVAFEFNSEMNTVVDPDMVIDEEVISKFDDTIPTFLGWIYDSKNKSYFNEIAFKELRDQLKLRIKSMTEGEEIKPADADQTYENKNDLTAQATETQEVQQPTPTKKAPF